ncbi:hypothetical protein MUO32_20080 [Shinella sp. CPCC 101442]|uniref:hypothetical protein n=1 Tax=Shinella sp. CPCC 101442 TaxID=2932265 RepID=UPI00215349F1|nr:hypothetical protein [Shinella sp. CPCC 101442]MCR6501337.1 hypothetical protein [Shinella sp. CPCC 101442]
MSTLHKKVEDDDARRKHIGRRLAVIEKDNERLTDMLIDGIGDSRVIDSRIKAQAQERTQLENEIKTLPQLRSISVHPSAIKAFAEKISVHRPKFEMALYLLDEMGELSRLIREIVKSITVSRDDEGRLHLAVESWLDPFLHPKSELMKAHRGWGAVSLVAKAV